MATIAIVVNADLSIRQYYTAAAPNYALFGGDNGNSAVTTHLALPVGLDMAVAKAQADAQGVISLVQDNVKAAALNSAAQTAWLALQDTNCETSIQSALTSVAGAQEDYTTHLMVVTHAHDVIAFPADYQVVQTGTLALASTSVTGLTTSALTTGMAVTGTGIPANTTISAIVDSQTITLSNAATAAGAESLNFDPTPVAQATLAAYRPVFQQIQQLRTQRDATKAALTGYVAPYTIV